MFWRRKRPERGLKALAEGGLAFARTYSNILAQTESKLDHAIDRDNRKPKSTIGKVRMKGEKIIHSKQVLLSIVLLNIIDCILVLGELILDIYILKGVLDKAEYKELNFVINMKQLYPDHLAPLDKTDIGILYDKVLEAHIEWDKGTRNSHGTDTSLTSHNPANFTFLTTINPSSNTETATPSVRRKRAITSDNGSHGNTTVDLHGNSTIHHDDHEHEHPLEEELAHAFHKASIAILAILAVETMLKVFFFGKEMLERKLEMFDGFIVFASFVVDIVFLKGMSGMHVREMVVILAFLVPWRVIRVVNSLVVAVIDHEHFRMKLLYKQKKEVSTDLKKMKAENKSLMNGIDILKKMAISAGVTEQDIEKSLAIANVKGKKKKGPSISSIAASHFSSSMKKNSTSVSSEPKTRVPSIEESELENDVFGKVDDPKSPV
ncbi:uncharacterized protein LOC110450126 isoform X2 [Mizuhopecten yessoensis]|nr:uncharacterized protein LOC110450126 isoform X2 [Mizuhopecten yessoensis]XP_021353075.1 uncharacterized protein LOC110450126 isoform X2 [Mizuhopecten yessoensis]